MRRMTLTGDQHLVKRINRMALVRLLREEPGLSRADLSTHSGLTKSTISILAKELIDEGWLLEEEAQHTGSLGRRPKPLRLNSQRLALIGAELGIDAIQTAAVTINGEVIESQRTPLRSLEPQQACHQLIEQVLSLAAEVKARHYRLMGIGVGLPGAVDERAGVLKFAPNIGWRDVELGRRLSGEAAAAGLVDVPIYYQNEADLAAIGEFEFGEGPADDPLIFLSCGIGVGAGIVLNDRLFSGASGLAGEVGHTILQMGGPMCSCGRRGCAEALIGARHIATPDDAARAGAYLGVLIQNVWMTFNPTVIVLGGETVERGAEFLDPALSAVQQFAAEAGIAPPQIRIARYGSLATAVGGAAYVLHCMLRPIYG
jgi:predicted NBD/HSP70 family sugar kinase